MNTIKIKNIAELKTRKGIPESSVEVLGYYTEGDGGGGNFYWDNLSTETDNGGTILSVSTVSNGRWKRIYDKELNVKWFGAKGDGVTNDTVKLQSAIDNIDNTVIRHTLIFSGKFKIDGILNLRRNINYDFYKSSIYSTIADSPTGYIINITNQSDFSIKGGMFKMEVNSKKVTIGTGIYAAYSPIFISDCDNFEISDTYMERMFVGLMIYNSKNYKVFNNYMKDCNAGIANVAETGKKVYNFTNSYNIIESCGDDGIYLGGNGGDTELFLIDNNIITKTTRSNDELDGSVIAAVGIRAGQYGGTQIAETRIINGIISNNLLKDMVNQGIVVHDANTIIVVNNVIDGYSKYNGGANQALAIGDENKPVLNAIVSGNIVKNAFTNMPPYKLADVTNVEFSKNHFLQGSLPTSKLTRLGDQVNVVIKDNYGFVTEKEGIAEISYISTSFDFAHSLDDIDNIYIEITPLSDLGKVKYYFVDNITTGAFRININEITGNTSNPKFKWKAISNRQNSLLTHENTGVVNIYRTDYILKNSIKKGISVKSGDNVTTSFTIPHSLSSTPTFVNVQSGSVDAKNISFVTVDNTNITVLYSTAPINGTDNITLYWEVSV